MSNIIEQQAVPNIIEQQVVPNIIEEQIIVMYVASLSQSMS